MIPGKTREEFKQHIREAADKIGTAVLAALGIAAAAIAIAAAALVIATRALRKAVA